jgi:pimeloyl-ACP methyl ester carboxylesterase
MWSADMTPEQIMAAVALLTSEPDPALDTQSGGGFHTRDPAPREGFDEPVRSDVPVLVAGGTNDPQTSWTWSLLAAETLGNSRVVIFPNAGHGASLCSDCGKDVTVTVILDPGGRAPHRSSGGADTSLRAA